MPDINTYLNHPSNDDPERMDRHNEMRDWDRETATRLAEGEGITLTPQHWEVITCLRKHYLEHGWPVQSHMLMRELDKTFSGAGGRRHLYHLFPGGPITQGCRVAGLPRPANTTDESFGSAQ